MKRLIPTMFVLVLALAGCGQGQLSDDDGAKVFAAELMIKGSCYGELTMEEEQEISDAIDTLVKFFREDPDAVAYSALRGDTTVRQSLAAAASSVDECDPDLAQELDRELEGS